MRTLTKEMRDSLTPMTAVELLKEGNKRFLNNLKMNRNLLQQVNDTAAGQFPFAFILSCIDSRTSAELIFDQGLGDVFSCRIAGNILNEDILGSMEFACKVAGSKVVLVLGHSKCGAIKGACDGVQLGNLTGLLEKIQTVIKEDGAQGKTSKDAAFVEHISKLNVKHVMDEIPKRSQVIADMVEKGEIAIVGGFYEVETGQVHFLEQGTKQAAGASAELQEA